MTTQEAQHSHEAQILDSTSSIGLEESIGSKTSAFVNDNSIHHPMTDVTPGETVLVQVSLPVQQEGGDQSDTNANDCHDGNDGLTLTDQLHVNQLEEFTVPGKGVNIGAGAEIDAGTGEGNEQHFQDVSIEVSGVVLNVLQHNMTIYSFF